MNAYTAVLQEVRKTMATRRMLSKTVVESDPFFEMPADSQALYMHLVLNADDEGFVGNPETIRRMTGFSKDSLRLLIAKGFLISFQSGVVVVTHWEMQNKVQPSRKNKTVFSSEKELLLVDEQGKYLIFNGSSENRQQTVNKMSGECQQVVDKVSEQVRLGKVSIGKGNIYGANFESVWSVYPRKRDKASAYKAYNARLKEGYSENELMTATKAYAEECKKNHTEERYIKQGKTFFGVNTPFIDYLKAGEENAVQETEAERKQRQADEFNRKYS